MFFTLTLAPLWPMLKDNTHSPAFTGGAYSMTMKKHTFYHDGCGICARVGKEIVNLTGLSGLDIVPVGLNPSRLEEAKAAGIRAFPAFGNRLRQRIAPQYRRA